MKDSAVLAHKSFHVAYEIDMLRGGVVWLHNKRGADVFEKNAVLESFLIHVRNLIYFLWTDVPAKPDDMLAVDFFEDASVWKSKRPPKSALLQDAYLLTHKQVAHLTYSRPVDPDEREWAPGSIFQDIAAVSQLFVDCVPPDRVHPDLRRFQR